MASTGITKPNFFKKINLLFSYMRTRLFQILGSLRLVGVIIIVNVFSHLPHLNDIILSHRSEHPRFVVIPRKIRNFRRMPAVDEQQLGRAILGVLRGLLVPDARQIPHVHAPIRPAARQHGFVMRRPLHLEYLVGVRDESVKFRGKVAHIPERHGLVRRSGCEQEFAERVERHAVYLPCVRVHAQRVRIVPDIPSAL